QEVLLDLGGLLQLDRQRDVEEGAVLGVEVVAVSFRRQAGVAVGRDDDVTVHGFDLPLGKFGRGSDRGLTARQRGGSKVYQRAHSCNRTLRAAEQRAETSIRVAVDVQQLLAGMTAEKLARRGAA